MIRTFYAIRYVYDNADLQKKKYVIAIYSENKFVLSRNTYR